MNLKRRKAWFSGACLAIVAGFFSGNLIAQDSGQDQSEHPVNLAVAAQNPLATMVSLPLQNNWNSSVGPYDRTSYTMNVQPVVPIKFEKFNLIARTIIPIVSAPVGETDSTFGLGDSLLQLYFSPTESKGGFTYGIGPVISLPTASNTEVLGSSKWGAGPGAVVFYHTGHWTMGFVTWNTWSFGGKGKKDDDFNQLTLQYFANYNFGKGWALGTAPIITANWKAESGQKWTIPFGLQVSKVTKIAKQPVNMLLGYYKNTTHPDNGPDMQIRFQINFLFPVGG